MGKVGGFPAEKTLMKVYIKNIYFAIRPDVFCNIHIYSLCYFILINLLASFFVEINDYLYFLKFH